MALTAQQIAERDGKLTASAVACLMSGDTEKILNLWRMLVGDPSYVQEDLSGVWAVQLGSWTEPLHLDWIERKHGPIIDRGKVVHHKCGWACATLDGWSETLSCPVEVKHVGGFEKSDAVVQRYFPQLTWQMIVTSSSQCLFSVIEGAREPVQEIITFDKAYADELWSRAEQFMEFVRTLTPPVELPPVAAPVKPTRELDMTTNNAWVSAAADWLETKLHADRHETAKDTIKKLVPADVIRAFGGSVEAKRDRANRLKIVEMKK